LTTAFSCLCQAHTIRSPPRRQIQACSTHLKLLCILDQARRQHVQQAVKVDVPERGEIDKVAVVGKEGGHDEPEYAAERKDPGIATLRGPGPFLQAVEMLLGHEAVVFTVGGALGLVDDQSRGTIVSPT
jgi:hypothetical protein